MLTRMLKGGRLFAAGAILLIGAGLACPTTADAKGKWAKRQARLVNCPAHKSVLRIHSKVCPATKRRSTLTVRRACCVAPSGRVNCKPFAPCPPRSPS